MMCNYTYDAGRLQTRKWTDKDGVEKYTTEIIADTMQMLGGRSGGGGGGSDDGGGYGGGSSAPARQSSGGGSSAGSAPRAPAAARPAPNFSDMDDDIPF